MNDAALLAGDGHERHEGRDARRPDGRGRDLHPVEAETRDEEESDRLEHQGGQEGWDGTQGAVSQPPALKAPGIPLTSRMTLIASTVPASMSSVDCAWCGSN